MPRRDARSYREYKDTMRAVIERANAKCEVMLDKNGNPCTRLPKVRRCARDISEDQARFINFLHKSTRNGESQDWVNDPDNIIYGCAEHHVEEEKTHIRVEGVDYDDGELTYIPED